jgi:FlgD Ig-like domain
LDKEHENTRETWPQAIPHRPASFILVLIASLIPLSAYSQPDCVALCPAAHGQDSPTMVSDGAGGAIVAWLDYRDGTGIYAQRVNAAGFTQWPEDCVVLSSRASGSEPAIVLDGTGGAIVTWEWNRRVYAQRVSASGVPQWTLNGVALCAAYSATDVQEMPVIVTDGDGGAIVAWRDLRNGGATYDIYAQRVNAVGVLQWGAEGTAVCNASNAQFEAAIAPDGAGGAIVTWRDYRSNINYDIYAQRIDPGGVPRWTADGVALCTAENEQSFTSIVADGAGGSIITWRDFRSGPGDIYAQRVDAAGVPQLSADGVAVCTDASPQDYPAIVSDGGGGVIVTWQDYRSGTNYDIYAQRVNALGMPQWTPDGVAVSTAPNGQGGTTVLSDGLGGAIITWTDYRSGTNYDVYAQRVNALGVPQWTPDGVAVCTTADNQYHQDAISDNAGGAIVAWTDFRGGLTGDIHAQHLGELPIAVAVQSFDAVAAGGVVTLYSLFRSDLGVEAVNVYRGFGTADLPLTIIERVVGIHGDRFEHVDRDVAPGGTYRYRIGVLDADGEFLSPIVTVSVEAIAGELAQNRPNPFNPTTTIRFVLPAREHVALAIYNANGRLIRTLVNEVRGHGTHEVAWDGRDDDGAVSSSGVYFYRLRAGKRTESKKMVLLK